MLQIIACKWLTSRLSSDVNASARYFQNFAKTFVVRLTSIAACGGEADARMQTPAVGISSAHDETPCYKHGSSSTSYSEIDMACCDGSDTDGLINDPSLMPLDASCLV